jgi:GDPmannose 4,6-dehydratase
VALLIGDPSKSKKLGWKPQYDLASLVKEMVASDLEILKRGNKILNYLED